MPVRERGGGGGGSGSGNASVGALLRQSGEDDKGLFVTHPEATLGWHMQGEAIATAESAAAASLAFANQDQDATLNVTLPLDWAALPETVNSRDVVYDRFPTPTSGAKAQYDYGRLAVRAAVVGTIGNRYGLRVVAGSPATAAQNARTDVDAWAGNPGLLRRNFRITAPNSVDPAVRASVLYRFGSRNDGAVLFRVRWHEAGTAGNGFQVNAQVHRDNDGTEQTVATYAADNRSITVVITGTAARRNEYPWAEARDAINAARTAQGDQLVVADFPGGSTTSTNFLNMPSTDGQTQSMTAAGNSLPNQITMADGAAQGTTADNTGAATNRGGVRVVTGDPSLSLAGASVDVNVAGDGDTPVIIRIVLTGTSRGAAGNNIAVKVRYDGDGQTNSIFARGTSDSSELIISINGTAGLAALLTELNRNPIDQSNGDDTTIFATATIQSNTGSSLNVTWGSTDAERSYNFSGGQDAGREPLSAVWDAGEHRLTITAVAADTLGDVFPIIAALDEFNTDTAGPGYVRLRGAADATNVIAVDSTVGDHIDYSFSNGSDGAARTPLRVTDNFLATFGGAAFFRLDITGALSTDTIQNVIDAYTAVTKNFELSAASGSSNSDNITGQAINTSLTGGVDAVSKRLPVVTLADTGVVTIGLHAVDDATTNSTLAELRTAWHAVTYTNTEGTNVVLPNTAATVDTSGGGAATDPVRNQTLPTAPTGGRNEVAAGTIEILVRPEDEVDGPNVLLRYADAHTLQDTLDGFIANNPENATIEVVYGTDLSANPESPPFVRSFYDSGAEAPINTTGGLTQSQVDARVRALAKGYAIKGGPVVPDTELADDVARDSEIPGLFRDALNAGALSTAFTERIPFLAGQTWATVDLQGLRQRIKQYVGAWSDTPGFFVFRKGDLTDHNDALYWVNTQTTKDLSNGPETNPAYTLLSNHMGAWTNRFVKAGTTCIHNSIAYIAPADIAQNAGTPPAGGWLRISQDPNTVVDVVSKPSVPLTLTARNAQGTDTDVTVAGASDSIIDVAVVNGMFRSTTRAGAHHDDAIPSGGTEVAANPAGSDGDILDRIEIGGVNYIVNASEVPVGMATIVGRNTAASEKFPTDLADHTDPLKIPLPIIGSITDADTIAAAIDWPVVPLYALATDGGIASNLDTTANSVEVAEGMYIVGMGVQNIWLDATSGVNQYHTPWNQTAGRITSHMRISIECVIERWDGSAWVELGVTNSPYGRQVPWGGMAYNSTNSGSTNSVGSYAPAAHEGPGGVDNTTDNNPAYAGVKSPVDAALYSVIAVPPGGSEIRFRMRRGHTLAPSLISEYNETTDRFTPAANKSLGNSGLVAWGYYCDVPGVSIFPLGRPTQTQPIVPRPHISLFRSTSGNLTPVAGDIGGTTYGYEYAIAQSAHAGAARIIGFKGSTKPTGSANVLATLTDLAHGSGTVDIPTAGATLAAGEEYRQRLQVFAEGVTPGVDTEPDSYQDIVIRAHAAATAEIHWTYVQYDSNDADAAATAARVDFANDIATYRALPDTVTITVPADTNEYQLALSVKSDQAQPAGFTSAGVNASGSFYAAQTRTVSSVEYKIYILKPLFRVTSDDNGDTFGVTP